MLKVCAIEGKTFDCCKFASPTQTDLGISPSHKFDQTLPGVCYKLELNATALLEEAKETYYTLETRGLHILLDANVDDQFDDESRQSRLSFDERLFSFVSANLR